MSILIDLAGVALTAEDRELLRHPVCAGVVLFSRNYQHLKQLQALTQAIREINPQALIAVDQEGGPVQRFRNGFTPTPSMAHWGRLYDQNPQNACRQLLQTIACLSRELREAGVNLNLIPVLDLNRQISAVIGERSLHSDPEVVTLLAEQLIEELQRQHFPAVGKHFPGHGGVAPDSHQILPVDSRDWATLWRQDLRPFIQLLPQLNAIMPAHIVFEAMDHRPVSFSPFWLQEVLRRQLRFTGLIISDDLTMGAAATQGDYAQRAVQAFLAGCDLLLICNHRPGAIRALDALLPLNRTESIQRFSTFMLKS
jgi:beta-N-acetylhexosaminidase